MTLHREAGHIIHDFDQFIPGWGQILYRIHGWQKTTFTNIPQLLLQTLLSGRIMRGGFLGCFSSWLFFFCCTFFFGLPLFCPTSCLTLKPVFEIETGLLTETQHIFLIPTLWELFATFTKINLQVFILENSIKITIPRSEALGFGLLYWQNEPWPSWKSYLFMGRSFDCKCCQDNWVIAGTSFLSQEKLWWWTTLHQRPRCDWHSWILQKQIYMKSRKTL